MNADADIRIVQDELDDFNDDGRGFERAVGPEDHPLLDSGREVVDRSLLVGSFWIMCEKRPRCGTSWKSMPMTSQPRYI
jgi:hypothetical protein